MKQGRLSLYTVDLKYVRNLANHDKNGNVRSISPQIEKKHSSVSGYYCYL